MSDMSRTRAAPLPSKTVVVLRLLGALLCMGGGTVAVATEVFVLLNQAAIEHAQYAQCAAVYRPFVPTYLVVDGPQQDLCIAPGVLALLVIGMRVLLGKSPGIAPPAAALLLVGGALATYALLFPLPIFRPGLGCGIVLTGSYQTLFPAGLLAGLVGSIVLSRTTRYRALRLEDA